MSSSNSNILERPGMTERIAKAREKLGDSPAARRASTRQAAPAAKPTSAPAIASAAAPVQSVPAGGHDVTLDYLFPDTRWFTLDEIAELVDGIDRQTLGKQLAHPAQVIGSDVRRFLQIYALQNRVRIAPKPSVVAEILASRAAKEERRAEICKQVRAEAQRLLDLDASLVQHQAAIDQCRDAERKLREEFSRRHGAELRTIAAAEEATRRAECAAGPARGAAEQLRALAHQYENLGVLAWDAPRGGTMPRLLPETEEAGK